MPNLVQPLFNGPLDIIGDVHGEMEPLQSLLHRLGYDESGRHPRDRKLIFVGDLTDRGPDSPGVVELVQQFIDSERAQCVLGNHDLNLLLGLRKHDNSWFYGETFQDSDGEVVPQKVADELTRNRVLDLFNALPLALERDDLRVIHAAWDEAMIEIVRDHDNSVHLFQAYEARINESLASRDLDEIDRELEHHNLNPVKRLTSGPEERVAVPFVTSGKQRFERRVHWWNTYSGPFCVFGHYSILEGQPRGNDSTLCIDYGVGKRWIERKQGRTKNFKLKLAALRWPEQRVVFDE